MFFSVVVPIYNSEETLVRCLESIRNQDFSDFEVIMVNDGSQDSSGTICERYIQIDSRFRYVFQKNSGVSVARNTGMREAKGEYITFIDSDDIYFNTYLSSFYELIEKYPDCGHYWCVFIGYGKDDKPNGEYGTIRDETQIVFSDRSNIMLLHELSLDGSPCNKVYQKKILDNVHMDPDLSLGEDLIFNLKYLEKNPNTKIVINNIPQYGYYCISENSLDHKYRADLEEIYDKLIEEIRFYLVKWKVSDEQWRLFYNTEFYMYEKIFQNIFRGENTQSKRKKYEKCNKILSSSKFKEALLQSKCTIHIVYRVAYWLGRYEIIVCLNKILKMVKRCKLQRRNYAERKKPIKDRNCT